MSLTNILINNKFQNLRDLLKKSFPKPSQDKSIEIKAPPLTDNYSLVGTAFDYLIRFQAEFKFPNSEKEEWVASLALRKIKELINKPESQFYSFYYRNKKVDKSEFYKIAKKLFQKAKSEYQKYLNTGYLSDNLYESIIILAQFDPIFRRGVFLSGFGEIDQKDIVDLKKLVEIIPNDFFQIEKRCLLNPNFGIGSKIVFGADADLIIDDDLIDIKVTKEIDLKRTLFNQIIGYYFLSLIGGINGDKGNEKVKNICIYFARYGYLLKLSISDFLNEMEIIKFKSEFLEIILINTKAITLKQKLNKVELFKYYLEKGYFLKEEIILLNELYKNKEKIAKHSLASKDRDKQRELLIEEFRLGLITKKEYNVRLTEWRKVVKMERVNEVLKFLKEQYKKGIYTKEEYKMEREKLINEYL